MSQTPKKWSKHTVADLKDELEKRGLPITGLKKDLLERLIDWDTKGDVDQSVKDEIEQDSGKMKEEMTEDVNLDLKGEPTGNTEIKEELLNESAEVEVEYDDDPEEDDDEEVEDEEVEDEKFLKLNEANKERDGLDHQDDEEDDMLEAQDDEEDDILDQDVEEDDMMGQEAEEEDLLGHDGMEAEGDGLHEEDDCEEYVEAEEETEDQIAEEAEEAVGEEKVEEDVTLKTENVENDDTMEEKPESGEEVKETDEGDVKDGKEQSDMIPEQDGMAGSDLIVLDELDDSEESKTTLPQTGQTGEVAKKEKEKEVSKEGGKDAVKKESDLPPMSYTLFSRWITLQLSTAQKERVWRIKSLKSREAVFSSLMKYAKTSVEFSINYTMDGKGYAVLKFLTAKESRNAQSGLNKTFGRGNVGHYYDSKDSDGGSVSSLASRTIVVQGLPSGASEEDVSIYFPGAKVISQHVRRRDMKVVIPEEIETEFFIQFSDRETALNAIKAGANIRDKFTTAVVKEMRTYLTDYKSWEAKQRKAYEEKKRLGALTKVFSDSERVEMCKALKSIHTKMSNGKPDKEEKLKLRQQMTDLRKAIDADTIERLKLKLEFPEPEKLMTLYTKEVSYRQEQKKLRDPKDRRRADERSKREAGDPTGTRSGHGSRRPETHTEERPVGGARNLMADNVKKQLANIYQDMKGFYTVSVLREGNIEDALDIRRKFKRFGMICDWNMTNKRAYIRFQHKEEAEAVVMDLGAIPRWEVMVPTSHKRYSDVELPPETASPPQKGIETRTRTVSAGDRDVKVEKKPPPPKPVAKVDVTDQAQKTTKEDQVKESTRKNATTSATKPQPAVQSREAQSKPTKVYLSNIRKGTAKERIKVCMSRFGVIVAVKIENYRATVPSTTGEVIFKEASSASKALSAKLVKIDGMIINIGSTPKLAPGKLADPGKDDIPLKRQVFVRNLTPSTTDKMLLAYFSNVGRVEKARIHRDPTTNESKGLATVTFRDTISVSNAVQIATHIIDGQTLTVEPNEKRHDRRRPVGSAPLERQIRKQVPSTSPSGARGGAYPPRNQAPGAYHRNVLEERPASFPQETSVESMMMRVTRPAAAPMNTERARHPPPEDIMRERKEETTKVRYYEEIAERRLKEHHSREDPHFKQDRHHSKEEPHFKDYHHHSREESHFRDDHLSREDYNFRDSRDRYHDAEMYDRDQHKTTERVVNSRDRDYYEKKGKHRYEEERERPLRSPQRDTDIHDDRKYYDERYGHQEQARASGRRDDREKYVEKSYSRGHSREVVERYEEKKYTEPERYRSHSHSADRERVEKDRYEAERSRKERGREPDRYDEKERYPANREPEKRKMYDERHREDDRNRNHEDLRQQGRYGDDREMADQSTLKKRRMNGSQERQEREASPLIESEAMANVLKTIGQVISSKMEEIGQMETQSEEVAPKEAPTGQHHLMQQRQVLQQQQMLQQQALHQQQAVLQQQQQQLLLHKQQEQQLQQELMELQKMKEAALREAQGAYAAK